MKEADLRFGDTGIEHLVSGERYVMWVAPNTCVILFTPHEGFDEFQAGSVTYTIDTCDWKTLKLAEMASKPSGMVNK